MEQNIETAQAGKSQSGPTETPPSPRSEAEAPKRNPRRPGALRTILNVSYFLSISYTGQNRTRSFRATHLLQATNVPSLKRTLGKRTLDITTNNEPPQPRTTPPNLYIFNPKGRC